MDFSMNIDTPFEAYATGPLVQAQRSFISLIPNEILLDIFDMVPSKADARPHTSPVALSHVSELWRGLMLCSPKFWTTISIHETFTRPVTHFPATLSRVLQFLERSATSALSINVVVVSQLSIFEHFPTDAACCGDIEIFRRCIKILSDILAPHVWRFKSFDVVCDDFPYIADIQHRFPLISMPLLESWHVRQTFGEELAFEGDLASAADMTALHIPLRPDDVAEEKSSSIFPLLTSAIFSATPMKWSRFCPRNLRFLEISFLPTQARPDGEVLRQILLANEHSLVSLKISGAAPTSRASQPYVMSKLERLELGYAFPDELIPLVEDIKLPNLTNLVIEDLYRSSTPEFAREQLEYDHTTALLFQIITDHFPLRQVKDLELRHICLLPPLSQNTPTNIPIVLVPDLTDLVIPITPFEFFCEMVALKNLTLVDPDIAIIFTLSHIPVVTADAEASDDFEATLLPAPALDYLHFKDFDQDLVRLFLTLRTSNHTSFRHLSKLTFGDPSGCLDTSASWMKTITLLDDVFLLAEKIEYIETDRFSNVEVELGLHMPYPT
jgi:hypothetical protein